MDCDLLPSISHQRAREHERGTFGFRDQIACSTGCASFAPGLFWHRRRPKFGPN